MESVPPTLYGGTERIVSYLTEELVRQGHEVTLFASGGSRTAAELVASAPRPLRLSRVRDPAPYNVLQLEHVRQRLDEFDVLHFHTDYMHFPMLRDLAAVAVTTMHGRLDFPELAPLFHEFHRTPLVSISAHQRRPLRANFVATVPHGLPRDLYALSREASGGYLAFLGRISPEKGPTTAIEIARRAGMKLKIAAKVDMADQEYFKEMVRPLLNQSHVEFIGEIGEDQKGAFLGQAKALLFPIDWPEPFGLVMIEAMACGTPVIAHRRGSVPEIIEHGVSGFIVDSLEEAVAAAGAIDGLDRAAVRRCFEARFTAEIMARSYVRLYERLARLQTTGARGAAAPASQDFPLLRA
ncbi:glycosyl transferase [Methylocystis bryophila]|nr:glycosyl transferase [Methylocystis bryophila]